MQTDTERTKIEHALKTVERVYFDSIKEEYENVLPNSVITVYAKKPEFHESGGSSGCIYEISDDTLTEEELDLQLYSRQESLNQRFLDKAATYPDSKRNPDVNNRMRFLGLVLNFGDDFSAWGDFRLRSEVDKSDFYEIGKIGIKQNKKIWDHFWDTIQISSTVYTILTFIGVDVNIPEIINLINDNPGDIDIQEIINQIRDMIEESGIPEKVRDIFDNKKFISKNEHSNREVGINDN